MDKEVYSASWRTLLWTLYVVPFFVVILIIFFRIWRHRRVVAFFHPYCNAGGGGERVLWCAINGMQKRFGDKYRYVVYTGDVDVTAKEILKKAKECFNIDVNDTNLQFVYLRTRFLLDAEFYPRFTLLLQSIGGFFVGLEALLRFCPEVFIDTMGYPFALPLFRWVAGCRVSSYVHYPVISCDMINVVESSESTYNNAQWIAESKSLTYLKLMYYRLFASLYRWCGTCCNIVMVNGTWTRDHIDELWGVSDRMYLIYPPCNVDKLLSMNSKAEAILASERRVQMLSIGQIRPEKDHRLQICFLTELKKRLAKENLDYKIRLVICGGCRDTQDHHRAKDLQAYAATNGLTDDDLEWALNVPAERLASFLEESLIGIHTMQNEHFGISVVEGIAAGQIMIAHKSGGPKLDILNANAVGSRTPLGYLASSVHDFVDCTLEILAMSPEERDAMRLVARKSVDRFKETNFEKRWNFVISKLLS